MYEDKNVGGVLEEIRMVGLVHRLVKDSRGLNLFVYQYYRDHFRKHEFLNYSDSLRILVRNNPLDELKKNLLRDFGETLYNGAINKSTG